MSTNMIEITDEALAKLKERIAEKQVWGIRLSLKPNGCNGYSYDLSYLEEPNVSGDAVFYEIVAGDPMTFSYVDSLTIEWKEEGLSQWFEIRSPNEVARCGCGESFTL